jgi:hypothetical protein
LDAKFKIVKGNILNKQEIKKIKTEVQELRSLMSAIATLSISTLSVIDKQKSELILEEFNYYMDKVLDEDSSELTKEVRELTTAKRNSSYTKH